MSFTSDEVAPRASSMIETMRAIGYTPASALADLVDNSISATARRVSIHFEWRGRDSYIVVEDDGDGMSGIDLIEAMRLGSAHPDTRRSKRDLGRFGMGLKTASFSQCRRLTVLSRKNGYAPVYWCWDLDHVAKTNRWELLRRPGPPGLLEKLEGVDSGTIVVWEQMDNVVGDVASSSEDGRDRFYRMAHGVKKHLAMVFHRFIESGSLSLFVNNIEVDPWNPFLPGTNGTQSIADESLLEGRVRVKSYVLPRLSKLSSADRERAGGVRGWNAMQGFYVYRSERLLVGGNWLGLFRRDEDTKLARIMVDISNEDDRAWQIDIKKSRARPPAGIADELDRLGRQARTASISVYRTHVAGPFVQPGIVTIPLWDEVMRQGQRFYRVNRDHPAVAGLLANAGDLRRNLETILRMVEESVPVARIFSDQASDPEKEIVPLAGEEEEVIVSMIETVYSSLAKKDGPENALNQLRIMEPFSLYPYLLERLIDLRTE
jgi:hypothetical protein